MTRFVVDAGTVLHLVSAGIEVAGEHELLAPTLLGDGVLRRRAWDVADELGWDSTYNAEYIALTLLQADAFVRLDDERARSVEGVVATAPIEALR